MFGSRHIEQNNDVIQLYLREAEADAVEADAAEADAAEEADAHVEEVQQI